MAERRRRTTHLFLTTLNIGAACIFAVFFVYTAPDTQADGGGVIVFDVSQRADLLFGERDTWTFRGVAGQQISIAAEADTRNNLNTTLELLDNQNQVIARDEDSGVGENAALLGILLPEDGLYAVQVIAEPGTEGYYTLTLSENALPAGCTNLQGSIESIEMYSQAAGEQLRYSVYMPPCAESTTRRYPYILLMHGSASTNTHWDTIGMDEALTVSYALNKIPPVALLLPYGGEIANLNYFGGTYSYENVVLNEIMPDAEMNFCLQNEKAGRAIGGISRGGFWAWEIGLRHPQLFSAIGGHSPVFDWQHAPASHNPLYVIDTIIWDEDFPRLYIDRGGRDWWAANIDLMAPLLERNNIPATVVINESGTHDEAYWRSQLNAYIAFYTAVWSSDWTTYPSCN